VVALINHAFCHTGDVTGGNLPQLLTFPCRCSPTQVLSLASQLDSGGSVRGFRQFSPEDAIGSHACSLEAIWRVTNDILLGRSLFSPVHTMHCLQSLKANAISGITGNFVVMLMAIFAGVTDISTPSQRTVLVAKAEGSIFLGAGLGYLAYGQVTRLLGFWYGALF
jgi:hypothetical protein